MTLPNPNQLGKSQEPSEASQYLPGGPKYQEFLVDSGKNPRQGLPIKKWISNWTETYGDNGDEAQPKSVKVTDELQRDLMTLEYLSELKRKTEGRRTETTNVSDKRAKDNN